MSLATGSMYMLYTVKPNHAAIVVYKERWLVSLLQLLVYLSSSSTNNSISVSITAPCVIIIS